MKGFDFYADALHFGNREDRELDTVDEDGEQEWYSWHAERIGPDDYNMAEIKVYGDTIPTERWHVTWKRIA